MRRAHLNRENRGFSKFLISLTPLPTLTPESRQRYKGNKEMTGLIPALHTPNASLSLTGAAAPGYETGPQTVPGKPKRVTNC